jgi:hypothetical protein
LFCFEVSLCIRTAIWRDKLRQMIISPPSVCSQKQKKLRTIKPPINPAPRQPSRLPGTTAHGARTVRHVSRTKRQAPQNRFTPTKTTREKVSNQAQSPGITPILGKTGAG